MPTASLYSRNRPSMSRSSSVSIRTNAPRAAAPSRAKSESAPRPASTSGRLTPAAAVAVGASARRGARPASNASSPTTRVVERGRSVTVVSGMGGCERLAAVLVDLVDADAYVARLAAVGRPQNARFLELVHDAGGPP